MERGSQRPTPIKSIIDSYQGKIAKIPKSFFVKNHFYLGPRKIPPHLDRHGTAQSHLSTASAQHANQIQQATVTQQQSSTSNLEREKSFVSDASFARQETRGSLTSIKEEDQRKKSERSGSLAPSKAPISESLKAEVNYIKADFNYFIHNLNMTHIL